MKVLIIHARRTGYGAVRSLKDHVDEIYLADDTRTAVFRSKWVKNSFLMPKITDVSDNEFLNELISLAKALKYEDGKPIVFTGKDDYLLFFSKYYEELSKYFTLSFESDFEKLNNALSKKRLAEYAKIAGVLIPKTFDDTHNIEEVCDELIFPLIIKPAIKNSPEMDVAGTVFRVRKCRDREELTKSVSQLEEFNIPYVVQEYIPGDDSELYTLATYSMNGELKAWSMCKKLRQFPPNTGECSLGVTLFDESLVNNGKKILESIGLTGISQIEFKKYKDKYYLIEINPRLWSWHQIHHLVGVNFCKIAIDHITGRNTEFISPENKKVCWMFFWMDFMHNVLLNKNISILQWLKSAFRSDIEAFFSWKDPMPFIMHTKQTLPYIRKNFKNG